LVVSSLLGHLRKHRASNKVHLRGFLRVRVLLVPTLTALALLGVTDALVGHRIGRHFLPEQKMEAAVAAGPGCILLLGDSRMDAAYSSSALHNALRQRASDRCVGDLSIGGTDVRGAYLAAREYLARGGSPQLVVVGEVADSLLDPDSRLDPQQMAGNNAIHLVWSRSSDIFFEAPGFPLASIDAFDAGFRFLIARATAIGRYQSLFWVRVQGIQDRLVGGRPATLNRFGRIADMDRLEEDLRTSATARLERQMTAPSGPQLGTWFMRLVRLLRDRGVPFAIAELPMRSSYRRAVTETAEALAYRRWVGARIAPLGGTSINLAEPSWIDDSLFADALHLNERGAQKLSADLGDQLAALLGAESRPGR
jgi:hypothetical protein